MKYPNFYTFAADDKPEVAQGKIAANFRMIANNACGVPEREEWYFGDPAEKLAPPTPREEVLPK